MEPSALDIANMFAGSLVLLSFAMLYRDRLQPLINTLSLHSLLLGLSVGWQAQIQHAPQLYVTAFIAISLKCILIPIALQRMVLRMGIHREIEGVIGTGITMLIGIGLV
ncbi:MAG TPA: hydrogenase-4 component E, partial [Acidisoma sp.]|nr:hydrogenase-4 component E [Acidisoma sp.]